MESRVCPCIRAIRNAIQGRECLRMRCKREIGTADIAHVAAEIGHSTEFEVYGHAPDKVASGHVPRSYAGACALARHVTIPQKQCQHVQNTTRFFPANHGFPNGKNPQGGFNPETCGGFAILMPLPSARNISSDILPRRKNSYAQPANPPTLARKSWRRLKNITWQCPCVRVAGLTKSGGWFFHPPLFL